MEIDSLWEWMGPGIEGLGAFAPAVAPIVAAAAAWAAVRTLRLRTRVDHADQWWKRVEYAILLLDSENQALHATGIGLLKDQAGTAAPELAWKNGKDIVKYGWRARTRWHVNRAELAIVRSLASELIAAEFVVEDLSNPSAEGHSRTDHQRETEKE